jgi:peptidoglycan hydrolase CwlO-like protein
MSKDKITNMLNDPEIKLSEEWQQLVYKMYLAIFGNGDSIFSQLKEFKNDIKKQLKEMSDHIQFINTTIDNYIDTENDYKVKFEKVQAELEVTRTKLQVERFWKLAILIIGPVLSVLATFGVMKLLS